MNYVYIHGFLCTIDCSAPTSLTPIFSKTTHCNRSHLYTLIMIFIVIMVMAIILITFFAICSPLLAFTFQSPQHVHRKHAQHVTSTGNQPITDRITTQLTLSKNNHNVEKRNQVHTTADGVRDHIF